MRNRDMILLVAVMMACTSGDDAGTMTSTEATGSSGTSSASATVGTSGSGMTVDTSSVTASSESTSSGEGAPFFISLATNVTQITEGESVIFTAIVSDPDGLDDIAGGSLFTEDGGGVYGPFVAAGRPGTYSITVSWSEVDQVTPIDFQDFKDKRVFQARFFDAEGHMAAQDVAIDLTCIGGGACTGSCKDLMNDSENCGTCGAVCGGGCVGGQCEPSLGECIKESDGFPTCNDYCQAMSEMCVDNGCEGGTVVGYSSTLNCMNEFAPTSFSEPCGLAQTWGPGRIVIRCCCSETI